MQINWVKNSQNNRYFDFLRLNINATYFSGKVGVYVIWYASPSKSRVIRVGQGNIGERLREHRNNPQILQYSSLGQLKVSWAIADGISFQKDQLDGVEAFLANNYNPLIGDRFPNVKQIPVNLL